jgi:predicted GTPase
MVGNKIDLNNKRVVQPVEGHRLAQQLGFSAYYEVSALHNINVNKPIEDIIQSAFFMSNMSIDSMSFQNRMSTNKLTQNDSDPLKSNKAEHNPDTDLHYSQDSNFSFAMNKQTSNVLIETNRVSAKFDDDGRRSGSVKLDQNRHT